MAEEFADESVARLARLFHEHPAWVAAAGHLSDRASSTVYFTHLPGTVWSLDQVSGETRLSRGAARDPDLVFRFSPGSIERLEAVRGGIGEFAVALFALIVEDEAGLRIAASFPRLIGRGYVRLLVAAGPAVLGFGAKHGIRTPGELRRFVGRIRSRRPAAWELPEGGAEPGRSDRS